MGTNAVVSVVRNGKTVVKAVTGCDGQSASDLAKLIAQRRRTDALGVLAAAKEVSFGCEDCLVVMDKHEIYAKDAEDLMGGLYYTKFDDPEFNPRWDRGTAAYVFTVNADDWTIQGDDE